MYLCCPGPFVQLSVSSSPVSPLLPIFLSSKYFHLTQLALFTQSFHPLFCKKATVSELSTSVKLRLVRSSLSEIGTTFISFFTYDSLACLLETTRLKAASHVFHSYLGRAILSKSSISFVDSCHPFFSFLSTIHLSPLNSSKTCSGNLSHNKEPLETVFDKIKSSFTLLGPSLQGLVRGTFIQHLDRSSIVNTHIHIQKSRFIAVLFLKKLGNNGGRF